MLSLRPNLTQAQDAQQAIVMKSLLALDLARIAMKYAANALLGLCIRQHCILERLLSASCDHQDEADTASCRWRDSCVLDRAG